MKWVPANIYVNDNPELADGNDDDGMVDAFKAGKIVSQTQSLKEMQIEST
jgi:hypothetical protein